MSAELFNGHCARCKRFRPQCRNAVVKIRGQLQPSLQIVCAACRKELAMVRPRECPGHGRNGRLPACCERAGEYSGFGSDGPSLFHCPKGCSCHD